MTRLPMSSRLMATAALGALMLAAVPAAAQQQTATAPATTTAAKPEIGDFGFDLAGMDKTVQPGDDFYAYANGTWAKNTPIPADKSNYGMFTALNDLSQTRTREILDAAKGDPNSMIGRAYASYLDSATVEAKGLAPIQPWLNKIRAVEKPGLAALLAEADRSGVQHFFGGYVGQDDKNPDVYTYIIFQGGIGMPDRDFYLKENERNTALQAAYLKHLENVLALAGEANAPARAKAIYDFEKQVATVHWDKNDSSDATKAYNKMTIAEPRQGGSRFRLADLHPRARGQRRYADRIAAERLHGQAKLLADAPIAVIRDLLIVRSLDSFSGVLPDAVAQEAFSFYSTALPGTPQMEERWKRGVDFTTGNLGDAVGKDYVAKYFPPETKAAMDELVKNVLGAMGCRIDGPDVDAAGDEGEGAEEARQFHHQDRLSRSVEGLRQAGNPRR